MIVGYLENVSNWIVEGWARDEDVPESRLNVSIRLRGERLGTATANVYRSDLLANGLAPGDYAFSLTLSAPITERDAECVVAEVETVDGLFELPRFSAADRVQTLAGRFAGALPSDESQRPIFVLGAARSGTSAMTGALRQLKGFGGFPEGHFLDILIPLQTAINTFYQSTKHEQARFSDTFLRNLPRQVVHGLGRKMLIDICRTTFGEYSRWVDKTPTVEAIVLSSAFADMWPNAKFIFMKRRFIENLMSRRRKFPNVDFNECCEDWVGAMEAWLHVSPRVKAASIEVDQLDMQTNPGATAERVGTLLELTREQVTAIEQYLGENMPERTRPDLAASFSISSLLMTDEQMVMFRQRVRPIMELYGYSENEVHFA